MVGNNPSTLVVYSACDQGSANAVDGAVGARRGENPWRQQPAWCGGGTSGLGWLFANARRSKSRRGTRADVGGHRYARWSTCEIQLRGVDGSRRSRLRCSSVGDGSVERWGVASGVADLAIEKSKDGQVSTAWFNGSLDVVRATLPAGTPRRLLDGWTLWENPPPTAEQLRELAKVVAPVCAVLAVPAGALVYGALTEDPWMWLGVLFWLLLPLLFIGLWLKEWWRYRKHLQALASGDVRSPLRSRR